MKHLLFTVFLILLTGSLFGSNYAVIDFVSEGGVDSGVVTGVQETFVSAFKPAGFTLVSKMKINRTAEEMGIQMSTAGPDKMKPVMDKLGITHIVVGRVIKVNGENMVSVKVFKLGGDIPMAAEQVSFSGSPIEPLKTLAQNLAKQLKRGKVASSKPAAKSGKSSSPHETGNSVQDDVSLNSQAEKETSRDAKACEYAKDDNSIEIWEEYLESFPEGGCAFEAKVNIRKLKKEQEAEAARERAEQERAAKEREEAERRLSCDSTPRNFPCKDNTTGYMWSQQAPTAMNWNEAVNYCKNLNQGGFSDWNLPDLNLLRTLIKSRGSSKLGDSGIFWSSMPTSSYDWAWYVNFSGNSGYGDGYTNNGRKSNYHSVRCVR